ncbi:MAG: outer membrane protein [Bauldia sp.]
MKVIGKSGLLIALLLAIPTATAQAADMGRAPPVYAPVPYEIGSNWYLRGDVGYKWYGSPNVHYDDPNYLADLPDGGNFLNEEISNTGVVGIGFGYRFSPGFRADFTLDYEWPGEFHGNLHCIDALACAAEYSDEFASIAAWTGLINGYLDLGTWGGFTPYLGAGVGLSRLTVSNLHFVNPPNSSSPGPGTWPGSASKWNFAWALMAGTSFAVSRDWLIDLNYRYVHLGDVESPILAAGAGTEPVRYDNITAQEIRIGVRYLLN